MNINKKGNVPITILVVGVVAICILALGSFVYSSRKINNRFNFGVFEDLQSDIEKFYFYTSDKIGMNNEEGIIVIYNHEIK